MPYQEAEPAKPEDLFECTMCGACCKGFGGTYVTETDIDNISRYLNIETHEFVERYCSPSGSKYVLSQGNDGYCVFWKDRLCGIHPVKPRMCKAWPFIGGVLKDVSNWRIMAGSCPGMNPDASDEYIRSCVEAVLREAS